MLGSFPDMFKITEVKTLDKINNSSTFIHYRPISLLPVISKTFDYFIDILSDYQFGLRPKHPIEHAALKFHDHIIHQLEEGKLHLVYPLNCQRHLIQLTIPF